MTTTKPELTEAEETRRGQIIAEMLRLKKDTFFSHVPVPRYKTEWGAKTALGLFRSVERIILDGE